MSFLIHKSRTTRCREPAYTCGQRRVLGGGCSRSLHQVGNVDNRKASRTSSRGEKIYERAKQVISRQECQEELATPLNIPSEWLRENSSVTATTFAVPAVSSIPVQKSVNWNTVLVESVVEVNYEECLWSDGMTEGGFKRKVYQDLRQKVHMLRGQRASKIY
jgi:hypothetical protein